MRRRVCIGILLIVVLCFTGCTQEDFVKDRSDGFFLWMDGYVALPVESNFEIALTYYFFEGKENYIHKDEIVRIEFRDVSNITVKDFYVQDVECSNETYEGFSLHITVEALEEGITYGDSVRMYLTDGTQYDCPLGQWCFEVGQKDSGLVYAYEGTFASSSPDKFSYKYQLNEGDSISELQYWHNQKITEHIKAEDVLVLEGEAPFRYVKSKGLVLSDGQEYCFYGLGCYCGALGADEKDIEMSYNRNKMK